MTAAQRLARLAPAAVAAVALVAAAAILSSGEEPAPTVQPSAAPMTDSAGAPAAETGATLLQPMTEAGATPTPTQPPTEPLPSAPQPASPAAPPPSGVSAPATTPPGAKTTGKQQGTRPSKRKARTNPAQPWDSPSAILQHAAERSELPRAGWGAPPPATKD